MHRSERQLNTQFLSQLRSSQQFPKGMVGAPLGQLARRRGRPLLVDDHGRSSGGGRLLQSAFTRSHGRKRRALCTRRGRASSGCYDAFRCHGVCLDALKARGGDEVRACFRETCESFDAGAADRLLAEEAAATPQAAGSGQTRAARPAASAASAEAVDTLKSGFASGAQVCQLWGLGACSKSETACGKAHVCPFCGSTEKGCFLKHPNHMATLKRHGGAALDSGRGRGRQQERAEHGRRRSRSRSRGRGGRGQPGTAAQAQRANKPVKAERSPSRSGGR